MTVSFTSQLKTINENTVHRYAVIWRLIRKDGTIFRFTDHNTDITYKSHLYKAAIGFAVSATQLTSGMSESNKTSTGILIPVGVTEVDGFTESDIRGGKYRSAAITEKLIDWQYPWLDELYMTRYTLADIVNDGFGWKAELISQAKFLRLPVGKIYNRNCRHNLGQEHHHRASDGTTLTKFNPGCGVNLGGNMESTGYGGLAIQQTTTVTKVTLARNKFSVDEDDVSTGYIAQVWRYGTIKFTSGLNDGEEFPIASSSLATGGDADDHSEITLFIDTPYDIEVGDTCLMTVGCNKTHSACAGKFGNLENFGGFPDIPGMDRAMFIPDRV